MLIPDIAKEAGLNQTNVIDIFTAMGGAGLDAFELFCDTQSCNTAHPNDKGYTYLASKVYKHLFNPVFEPVDFPRR